MASWLLVASVHWASQVLVCRASCHGPCFAPASELASGPRYLGAAVAISFDRQPFFADRSSRDVVGFVDLVAALAAVVVYLAAAEPVASGEDTCCLASGPCAAAFDPSAVPSFDYRASHSGSARVAHSRETGQNSG